MSVLSAHIAAASLFAVVLGLTSCSSPAPSTSGSANFYWSAARETYAAGDYAKTADHLEHVINSQNQHTVEAIPWYLVVTGGMAGGYIQLADQYTAGARIHKSKAAAFRTKAAAYRAIASQWAMRFAQNADKIKDIPLGPLPLAFGPPKGSATAPEALWQIGAGVELAPGDAEATESLTIQHSVLLAACRAAGANDLAKAEDILDQAHAEVTRATFGKAIAEMLEKDAALYSRNQLDEPVKLMALQERAEIARKEAARVGSARFVEAASAKQQAQ